MSKLIPVKYHKLNYPHNINLTIQEIAGHFDKELIEFNDEYSLHTEYSYSRRRFNSNLIQKYKEILKAEKNGIPQLWYNSKWAQDFAHFVIELTKKNPPKIIEIHPPFSDYMNIEEFIKIYEVFDKEIRKVYPNVIVLIENRFGSMYRGGKFIISTIEQLENLSDLIDKHKSKLKITIDLPQLLGANKIVKYDEEKIEFFFQKIKQIRKNILGVHLWGKKKNEDGRRVSHVGDLNDFFDQDIILKNIIIGKLFESLDDNVERYFVPEVNSVESDLHSIVNDLEAIGFNFVVY